jgi:hypothetical protein
MTISPADQKFIDWYVKLPDREKGVIEFLLKDMYKPESS